MRRVADPSKAGSVGRLCAEHEERQAEAVALGRLFALDQAMPIQGTDDAMGRWLCQADRLCQIGGPGTLFSNGTEVSQDSNSTIQKLRPRGLIGCLLLSQ